ncbi:MAG: FmdB family zinc ribbon protein [bacterium]
MPKYDYECDACNKIFEVTQRIHDDPLTECIYCGGQVRKLISSSAFLLKGEGWYVTDHPSVSRKKGMESEKKLKDGSALKNCNGSKKECGNCPSATVN